ncbi:Acyl-CoA synthetase (NDP forming) [Desulfatibacillum alkenivorans DSM 16219]|uniref:Acyl-CoA synthetase (NDP forming) n=1 Tax=Desulfatibacillum alkenivorans DSM 16219 TaxID=1121393 RepID=A0A1M6N297_9BACT|nr:acetate--CoA ligase family protein [Desulfatibacillum alkenivorans]SHJ89794.1 Acyl-CoA synthetase (NDP forming) [Desulfatibacillum alkenivorans DSM 16219]
MNQHPIIQKVLSAGRKALTESESKALLAEYGVPVVEEKIADSPEKAAELAEETGFPVVLKGLGESLAHKSEMGLVAVGLTDKNSVIASAKGMKGKAGDALEGFLVQPLVRGDREFVAGLFTDPVFGPVIMFGLGGVFTEALSDVVFRLAPCSEKDLETMPDEIQAKKLLGDFRGQAAADKQAILNALAGLSRLVQDNPQVAEVDINPLKIGPDGAVTAVDALVVLREEQKEVTHPPAIAPKDVARFFTPKSVALVGASGTVGKWGFSIATCILGGDFPGDLHLVNSKGGEILGRKVYKSVSEIPGPVDMACITIPAAHVMGLFPEFQAKGIRYALLITSGFGETGPEGKVLEKELVAKAREHDIIILGPNTMGLNNPHNTFYCTGTHIRPEPGATAFVSQSGNMGGQLMAFALEQGIGLRAFCGSGNEAMISIEDSMEAFEVDELTRTVVLYLESVKNGRRFYESARRLGKIKPVIVLKGGRTEAGGKAAASHTGAMASNVKVFDAACKQAGVVSVEKPMDLLDLSAVFSALPLPKGKRTAIMTLGGGWGVVTADLCNRWNLDVPPLPDDLVKTIDKILPPYWSRANPIDLVGENNPQLFFDVAQELARWDGCDAVLVLGIVGRKLALKRWIDSALKTDPNADRKQLDAMHDLLSNMEDDFFAHLAKLMDETHKPFIGVRMGRSEDSGTVIKVPGCQYEDVFFETPERAVKALSGMCEYRAFLDRETGE